jgi:hypothetical protein
MSARAFGWIPVLLAASLSTAGAANRCNLVMSPPVPVKIENLRPVIATEINGVETRFIVDTGSLWDFLSPVAAAELKLPLSDAPPGYYVSGINGSFVPKIATAKTFAVAGLSGHSAQFLVGNNAFGGDIAGILGQNIIFASRTSTSTLPMASCASSDRSTAAMRFWRTGTPRNPSLWSA